MKTRYLMILTALAFLGFSANAVAHPCDRHDDKSHKHCDNEPGGGDGDSIVYTAELTSGAFRFAGSTNGGETLIPPIYVITDSNKELGLVPLFEDEDVEMWRPDCGDEWEGGDQIPPTNYPEQKPGSSSDIDGAGPWANKGYENCTYKKEVTEDVWIPDWDAVAFDQATWDRMFEIGCPELETSDVYKIPKIISKADDWDFGEPGNYRLILRDIWLTAEDGVAWDVTMQLIAAGPGEWIKGTGDWLPDESDPDHDFFLEKGKMWGREVSGGAPGGRKSCHQAYSGTDERIEGFYLCEMTDGACVNGDVGVTMQIGFCDEDCRNSIPVP